MDIQRINPALRAICQAFRNANDFCCLVCGSSLHEDSPRDVDLMLYVPGDLTAAANTLKSFLEAKCPAVSMAYLPIYSLYSLKFFYDKVDFSIHAVSFDFVEKSISHASDADCFAEADIFCQDLKWPVVWRYWIQETQFCAGNQGLHDRLLESLRDVRVPYPDIQKKLTGRIRNQILYFQHKEQNGALCQFIIGCQLLNALLLYCYSINHKFIGTVKYIEQDLNGFSLGIPVVSACRNLFDRLSTGADIGKSVYEISKIEDFK